MKTRLNPDTGIREWGPDEYQARKGWVPWIETSIPTYNTDTQYIQEGDPLVESHQVTQTWLVVDKTTEVIESETENSVLQTKLDQFKQSATWTKIKNDQDLTASEIQTVIRFITRFIVKKIGQE
jgi:hypothetical protein